MDLQLHLMPGSINEESEAREDHMGRWKEGSHASVAKLKKSILIPQLKSMFQFLNPQFGTVAKGLGFRFKQTWDQTSALPLISQTLDKSGKLPEPQFPHL